MPTQRTVAEIQALARAAESHWAALHEQMEADWELYNHGPRVVVKSKNGAELANVNPTTAKNKADAAANHLVANAPRITIDKSAFPKSERRVADTLEVALQAIWWRATANMTSDPHLASAKNASMMGMGCFQLVPDFEEVSPEPGDDAPELERRLYTWRKKNSFPLGILSVDPREVFPDPGADGERWVIRRRKLPMGELRALFPDWDMPPSLRAYTDFDEAELLEYWSEDEYYYEVEGVPVERRDPLASEGTAPEAVSTGVADAGDTDAEERGGGDGPVQGPWRNPFGFIPYVVFSSGYGSPVGKPEHRFQGLITAARKGNLFQAQARCYGQMDAIRSKMAWGSLIGPPGLAEIALDPGTYNEVQPDANGNIPEPKVVGLVNPPSGIFAELQRVEDAIDQATVPGVLDSAESGSAESALKFVRKTQQALVGLNPLKHNLERAEERVLMRVLLFFDNPRFFGKDEKVFVWGMGNKGQAVQAEIGPGLIKGRHIPVFVEVRPALPEDEMLRIQTGLSGLNTAWGPLQFYDKFARWENPEEALEQLIEWQITAQVIQSGTIAAYIAALMTGQATAAEGIQGFARRQAAPPEGRQGAVEPTADVRSQQPQVAGTGEALNPGMADVMGNLRRILAARASAA